MNQKTNIIKKQDFERYEILLPFSAFAGKRRRQFLCSELEKMHPCFSDEYSFDSVIKKICKNGIKTDVLVMSKFKLAEYEGRRRFAGRGFVVDKKSEPFGRYFFMSPACKGFSGGLVFCLLLSLTGIICGTFVGLKKTDNSSSFENAGNSIAKESEVIQKDANSFVDKNSGNQNEDTCLYNPFFDAVYKADGSIDFFEWEITGFVEKINASVCGVFPECFDFIKESRQSGNYDNRGKPMGLTVSYENRKPSISLSYSMNHSGVINASLEGENLNQFIEGFSHEKTVKELREIFFQPDILLLQEKTSPLYFEIECQSIDSAARCLSEVKKQLDFVGWNVGAFFVRQNDNKKQSLRIGISIEETYIPVKFDLEKVSEKLSLFVKPQTENPAVSNALYIPQKKQNKTHGNEKKLGEIKRADNSIVIFYKNTDGKIEKRIETMEVGK